MSETLTSATFDELERGLFDTIDGWVRSRSADAPSTTVDFPCPTPENPEQTVVLPAPNEIERRKAGNISPPSLVVKWGETPQTRANTVILEVCEPGSSITCDPERPSSRFRMLGVQSALSICLDPNSGIYSHVYNFRHPTLADTIRNTNIIKLHDPTLQLLYDRAGILWSAMLSTRLNLEPETNASYPHRLEMSILSFDESIDPSRGLAELTERDLPKPQMIGDVVFAPRIDTTNDPRVTEGSSLVSVGLEAYRFRGHSVTDAKGDELPSTTVRKLHGAPEMPRFLKFGEASSRLPSPAELRAQIALTLKRVLDDLQRFNGAA